MYEPPPGLLAQGVSSHASDFHLWGSSPSINTYPAKKKKCMNSKQSFKNHNDSSIQRRVVRKNFKKKNFEERERERITMFQERM